MIRRKTVVLCRKRGGQEKAPAPLAPPAPPRPTCDTKLCYNSYKIHITRTSGFVSLDGRGMRPPSCDTRTQFLRRWGEGRMLPLLRHKITVLSPNQSSGPQIMIFCGIHHVSWISTPALRQKLGVGQTSTLDYGDSPITIILLIQSR